MDLLLGSSTSHEVGMLNLQGHPSLANSFGLGVGNQGPAYVGERYSTSRLSVENLMCRGLEVIPESSLLHLHLEVPRVEP